ncbi:hypothetical protein A6V27_20925 (plasmid) [Hafnia alvei]|jgi:putative membrane protein|uniref:DUF1440 domain-containing protein n=2 Tax=Hafnia alvei TaxID=569 RepID=UPI000583801F|nr:DUF1440 domain-containing protein [Hafnia alvei]ANC42883.1 hypothetical protein A6V27_20925 [Hafnia alvei]KID00490.1 hypothetical protein PU00_16990 [Hafnia alvei]
MGFLNRLFLRTNEKDRHYVVAFFIGIISGVISAFVKTGTEGILPPRTPDRASPPVQLLTDLDVNWHTLVYNYSAQPVYWGGNFVHIVFSVLAAIFYCIVAEIFPRITMVQGIVFGLVFAFICHAVMLPLLSLSPSLQYLPADEIISEIIGTSLWIWSIELLRIAMRTKLIKR